ncbi:MAG: cytochrome c oxidase subunit 3 [Polyangiaceae bacterium]
MAEHTSETHGEAHGSGSPPPAGHGHDHGHDHGHGHYPNLAHHFDTPQQQFDAGKLGIWLFLLTEVLFFSGLFCAYTIYRAMRPEVFVWAHYFLNTKLGALNTCVLLISSLTAAWAVRNAQLGETKKLVTNIVITIACACTFMVVKYFEYQHKFHDGLLPGAHFHPTELVWELDAFKLKHPEAAEYAEKLHHHAAAAAAPAAPGAAAPAGEHAAPAGEHAAEAKHSVERPTYEQIEPLIAAGVLGEKAETPTVPSKPRNAHVFFSIYFFMTGLHGIHVLAGIIVWVWLLLRAKTGVFNSMYFGPIDYAALYWHLVDLIWIYLFPLLYLIH